MAKRLKISLKRGAAITVNRISVGKLTLVYVLLADKKIQYKTGRSRVVYIGTTKNGIDRVAQSVATKAEEVLEGMWGVWELEARIVTCTPRQNVKSWHKLERAMLLTFREIFGQIPACNTQGKDAARR